MEEIWRYIPDYPHYQVSNHGRVRSFVDNHSHRRDEPFVLKQYVRHSGRLSVALSKKSKLRYFNVHRLVLLAFIGPCPDGMEGCHNDGNYLNNTLDNLRWDTRASNIADVCRHGSKRNEKNGNHRLTVEQVIEIRNLRQTTSLSYQKLAQRFSVGAATIGHIVNRDTWSDI